MCEFRKWYSDPRGFILECSKCGHMQLAFGTFMLTMCPADFKTFIAIVSQRKEHLIPVDNDCKSVLLPTPGQGCHFFLTEEELAALDHMLQSADTSRQTSAMLKLFESES